MKEYMGNFARKSGKVAKAAVRPLLYGLPATGAVWYAVSGEPHDYAMSIAPQVTMALATGEASKEAYKEMTGDNTTKFGKTISFIRGALLGAGAYEAIELLNTVPAANEALDAVDQSLKATEFPSQGRFYDIPVAATIAGGARYGWEGAKKAAKKITTRK